MSALAEWLPPGECVCEGYCWPVLSVVRTYVRMYMGYVVVVVTLW